MNRLLKADVLFIAMGFSYFVVNFPTAYALASSVANQPSQQQVLKDINLNSRYKVRRVIVRNDCAYILATFTENQKTMLAVRLAWRSGGRWVPLGGTQSEVVNNPAHINYSLSRRTGTRSNATYEFDWCLYGYTTDPRVTTIRIKTNTGYIPVETIDGQYFMCLMTNAEQESFVEVQGMNANGEVILRNNGVSKDKPRRLSPKHSELY